MKILWENVLKKVKSKFMKYIILIVLLLSLDVGYSQQTNAVSTKIADKMKDSLMLTASQRQQIYSVNVQLHEQKMVIRSQYIGVDSLRIMIQRVENQRDSLYQQILPTEKYLLYKEKKKNLVNNN